MSTRKFLKILYYLLSWPHYMLAKILLVTNLWGVREDFESCCNTLDSGYPVFPDRFVFVLALAEDHRSNLHFGIDHFAIFRAIHVRIRHNQIQGASTIEQQFVRVVTCRYKKCLSRKLKEQLIALLISNKYTKNHVAKSYLSIAYYGTGFQGVDGIKLLCGEQLSLATDNMIIDVIARLKYPAPSKPSEQWAERNRSRVKHIHILIKQEVVGAD